MTLGQGHPYLGPILCPEPGGPGLCPPCRTPALPQLSPRSPAPTSPDFSGLVASARCRPGHLLLRPQLWTATVAAAVQGSTRGHSQRKASQSRAGNQTFQNDFRQRPPSKRCPVWGLPVREGPAIWRPVPPPPTRLASLPSPSFLPSFFLAH